MERNTDLWSSAGLEVGFCENDEDDKGKSGVESSEMAENTLAMELRPGCERRCCVPS